MYVLLMNLVCFWYPFQLGIGWLKVLKISLIFVQRSWFINLIRNYLQLVKTFRGIWRSRSFFSFPPQMLEIWVPVLKSCSMSTDYKDRALIHFWGLPKLGKQISIHVKRL